MAAEPRGKKGMERLSVRYIEYYIAQGKRKFPAHAPQERYCSPQKYFPVDGSAQL